MSRRAADGVLVHDEHKVWPAAWRVEHEGHMLAVAVVFEQLTKASRR